MRLRTLSYAVNAIGYARAQDLVYGIGGIGHEGHVISIDHSGTPADLGLVRGVPRGDLALATAGAITGNSLYVRLDDRLFVINVDPKDPNFLKVVRVTRLRPSPPVDSMDDFAFDDADGLLYGVSTSYDGPAAIVSIDPAQGTVTKVATPAGLPDHSTYGSVVIGPDRTLYAINNHYHGRSRLYAIPHGGAAREVTSWPAAEITDAAGCLGVPAPPPPPPTTSGPKTAAPPVVPVVPVVPPAVPTTPVPPPVPPHPSPKPAPVSAKPVVTPPTTKKAASPPVHRAVASSNNKEVTKQRRWAAATVILLIGGGAVAGGASRARNRR